MDAHTLQRYQSKGGAASYAKKYEGDWRRRLSNWQEHRVVAQALFACGLGGRVLNMPCGAGRFGELLRERGFTVFGCDISVPMLEQTRRQWPWSLAAGSAFSLPYRSGSFDGVFIMRLLHHLSDAQQRGLLYREAARVSRDWVLITYADYHTPKNWIRETRVKWLKDRRPKITLTREQLQTEAAACGLRLVRVFRVAPLFTPLALALLRKA